jgi:hypothetical protein
MNITPLPIPVHKLPSPSGTDPVYLQSLLDNALAQMILASGADGRLPYYQYIESIKSRISGEVAHG